MATEPRAKTSRLGKGLSALIGEVEAIGLGPEGAQPVPSSEIEIAHIRPNPAQPRRTFLDAEMEELCQSIRKRGVLQPILVRPDPDAPGQFQIVAGERRWRAAKMAELATIPTVVRDVDELELLEFGIIENVQRSDLNPIEEAEAYNALMKRFGRTQESLAESVGKGRVHIANTLRLLNLPEGAREHLRHGRITAGHARAALGAPEPGPIVEMAVLRGLTVREVEALAKRARGSDDLARVAKKVLDSKDVDTTALEADLARVLGLSVDIRHKAEGGELRVKYRDLEQLDELCRLLTAKRAG